MQFKEITGQQTAKANLIRQVADNRISHAQLICGHDGWGGLQLAIAYAQYICCENKQETDSCGNCASCIKYSKLAHPDLHFVYPVATNKKITSAPVSAHYISEWREIITQQKYFTLQQWFEHIQIENKQGNISVNESQDIIKKLSLKSYEAEYKVMIIWYPEKMHTAAANKLLKILEEPPEKTLFLLVAQNTDALLKTILSRTQLIKLHRITEEDIVSYLSVQHQLTPEQSVTLARQCDGDMIKLLDIVDQEKSADINIALFKNWMRLCFKFRGGDLVGLTEEMASMGREKQKQFLGYAQHMIRQCLLLNYQTSELLQINTEEAEFIKNFSPFIHQGNISLLTEEMNTAHYHIERNANPKILFMDLSVKMNGLLNIPKN